MSSNSVPKILIVDSDSRQTELAQELIAEVARAQVDTTNSGERAIELVSRTTYQLVIADCGVGDMDGLSVLERVKRASPTTGVVLTSPFATIEEAVKAVKSGADEYFKKPFNPEQFKLAVRRCLDRRALFSGDQAVTGLMLLLNACQLVSGYLEEEKILETVMSYLGRETSGKGIALFRYNGDSRAHIQTSSDVESDVVEVLVEGHRFVQVARDEKAAMKVFPKTNTTPEVAVFQFRCAGDSSYVVVAIAPSWATPPDEVDARFRLLQAQVQMTGRNISNYRGVKHLLYLDEPTGLFNVRFLHVLLDQYFDRVAKGQKISFGVLFMDLDKFKGVNDTHGHLVGTKLLNEVGQVIKKCLRKTDAAFRYGGDEFVVLLDGVNSASAVQIAERIRQEIERNKFIEKEGLNLHLTASIGVAVYPEHAVTKKAILDAADGAMYAVKRDARNKVYIAERKAA
jgi:diguanylate cyclase (GGDEF)-like protein